MNITAKKLLNEKEVAYVLNVSVHFLQRQRRIGGFIPYQKIGSAVRYHREDLDAYLENQRFLSTSEYKGGDHE